MLMLWARMEDYDKVDRFDQHSKDFSPSVKTLDRI